MKKEFLFFVTKKMMSTIYPEISGFKINLFTAMSLNREDNMLIKTLKMVYSNVLLLLMLLQEDLIFLMSILLFKHLLL